MGRGTETYNVVFIFKIGVVFLHGLENCLEGGDEVVEDGGSPCFALEILEAAGIDDSHLLEDCGFAALTSTCRLGSVRAHHGECLCGGGGDDGDMVSWIHTEQQQLYFALGPLLVGAERLFDFSIFLARLRVCSGRFSSEAHDCWCHVKRRGDAVVVVGGSRDGAERGRDYACGGGLANRRSTILGRQSGS